VRYVFILCVVVVFSPPAQALWPTALSAFKFHAVIARSECRQVHARPR
jgi:hypothetical protein